MKTSELIGAQLDWAVAKCEGRNFEAADSFVSYHDDGDMNYSTDWSLAGPIIEREGIELRVWSQEETGKATEWEAEDTPSGTWAMTGPTPLIAAMRCFVASKLGSEVEIPKELK